MKAAVCGWLVITLLIIGCAGKDMGGAEEASPITPYMVVSNEKKVEVKQSLNFTEEDNGRVIVLQKGQRLSIELEENPTTGYKWLIKGGKLPKVVEQISSTFEPYSTEPTRVGAGGKRLFTFEAAEYGNGVLKLVYCRPWQCELSVEKEFSLSINVEQPTGE